MSTTELEMRLTLLEKKFANFVDADGNKSWANINGWIDEIHGTFANDISYRKATKAVRNWRKSLVSVGTASKRKAGGK